MNEILKTAREIVNQPDVLVSPSQYRRVIAGLLEIINNPYVRIISTEATMGRVP